MKHPKRVKNLLKKHNLKGVNKPKRTPKHKTKSHLVLAFQKGKYRLVRFGQQGVSGAGRNPKSKNQKARRRSFRARHGIKKESDLSKLSALYWSSKVKW